MKGLVWMFLATPNELLHSAVAISKQREALIDGTVRYTYGNLDGDVARTTALLKRHGIGAGDKVAHLGCNSPAHTILLFALARLGAIYVPFDPWIRPYMLKRMIQAALPKVLCLGRTMMGRPVEKEMREAQVLSTLEVECLDLTDPIWEEAFAPAPDGGADTSPWDEDSRRFAEQPFVILFTSGTTGEPRGIVYSQGALASQALMIDFTLQMGRADRYLNVFPASHYGGMVARLETVAAAACLIEMAVPDAGSVIRTIEKEKISFLVAVPQLWKSILSHPAADKQVFASLRTANVASDAVSNEFLIQIMEKTGAISAGGYGLTEAGLVSMLPREDAMLKLGSSGLPLPFTEVKILTEDGEPASPGIEGDVWVRSPFGMIGTWVNYKIEPPSVDQYGFVATRDIGFIDQYGYLTISGRKDSFMKVSGFRVSPVDIENILAEHTCIRDAAVVALPDEKLGQAPAALIVIHEGSQIAASQLRSWVVDRLMPQAAPVKFGCADKIPRTAGTGKIRRQEIQAGFLHDEYLILPD